MVKMVRFSLLFLTLIVGLLLLEIYEPVRQAVVLPFTSLIAGFCSWLIQIFDPNVIAVGDVIRNSKTYEGIQIAPGCNGVEAMIILFAAVVAFPSSFFYKIKGLFWGFLAIQLLNAVRIISLFYLLQWDKNWFEWFHLYVWQALIILDALVVWLIWLRYLPKKPKSKVTNVDTIHAV
jgi:exosortase H (IPTLxxWG-CTERM-specific)